MRRFLAGAALALSVTACSNLPGDLYATNLDAARAERVWRDPWLAPDRLTVPEAAWGSNGQVDRSAGTRETTYVGTGPVGAVAQEVRTAVEAGWDLVGATCGDDEVRAVLSRGGTDLDAAAIAEVGVRTEGPVDVRVVGLVPHHLDDDWPDLGPPVDPGTTCLAGGGAAPAPELPDETPRGSSDDDVDVPEWSDDGPSDEDRARIDALAADPWYAAAGSLPAPDVDAGGIRRQAPGSSGVLSPGPRSSTAAVAAVVADMDGWLLTYASCSARTGTVATLRLDGDAGPVIARLTSAVGAGGEVTWQVRLPVVGGPDQGWVDAVPALASARCLDAPTAPEGTTVDGTPVGLVEELQAMQ